MNPQNGKGSARRKGANDEAYADNYDRIFGNKGVTGLEKCPDGGVCGQGGFCDECPNDKARRVK